MDTAFDVVILLWLVLGVQLSWKKGSRSRPAHEEHAWIGIRYSLAPTGEALLRLPDVFLQELNNMLLELLNGKKYVQISTAEVITGRVGRIGPGTQDYRVSFGPAHHIDQYEGALSVGMVHPDGCLPLGRRGRAATQ